MVCLLGVKILMITERTNTIPDVTNCHLGACMLSVFKPINSHRISVDTHINTKAVHFIVPTISARYTPQNILLVIIRD